MKVKVNETLRGTEVVLTLTAQEASNLLMWEILRGDQLQDLKEALMSHKEQVGR